MFPKIGLFLCGLQVVLIQAQFQNTNFGNNGFSNNGFNNNGFNNGFQPQPFAQQTSLFHTKQFMQQGQSGGNAAAAGSAGSQGVGQAASVNQADHQADQFNTRSSGLSANTAAGFGSQASGAAQAGGTVGNAVQGMENFGSQQDLMAGRRKRQAFPGNFGGFNGFNGFNSQQLSEANGNAIGGGNAEFGQVATNNNAFSQTNPMNAMSFAAGNSAGAGQGVSIFQASNTNSRSGNSFGRFKRQAFGNFGGFNGFNGQSAAGANALGGGQAMFGQVATNNNAFSQTNPFGASGFAAGNSMGQGQGVSIFNAANTNAASGMLGRRR